MELLKEVLVKLLSDEEINVTFPNVTINAADLVKAESYKALQKIKAVINDDSLSDFECIEAIVNVLESIGSTGGGRHDFG